MASKLRNIINVQATNFARMAQGASVCSLGDTNVLVTAVSAPSDPRGFVPLTVDFKQKGGVAKRTDEMLACRIIDRSIRPGFRTGFSNDTQIICNLLDVDGCNDPDVLAINGASTSLALSDIPWDGPIGATRVGLLGETLISNPTWKDRENSRLNLIMAANKAGNIMMMDGSSSEPLLLPDIAKAIKFGIKECQGVINSIEKLQKTHGKTKKDIELPHMPGMEEIELVKKHAYDQLRQILLDHSLDKQSRGEVMKKLQDTVSESLSQEMGKEKFLQAYVQLVKNVNKDLLMETRIRCDGRELHQLRPISASVNLYKNRHGTAVFQRGQTQVFCSATFDAPEDKNFVLEYEFPPFATGETGRMMNFPGRREVGHGALAEKALRPLIPDDLEMTARLNCEVWESNGSSSMASVCAGSLSLMDAGVNIKEHVAGVAMGLIGDHILTDILGFEDYFGDMDFKIAGTKKAFTAMQLDVKLNQGVPFPLVYESLELAHKAKSEIINKMNSVIRSPRKEKKECHPVTKTIYVPPHKKSKFIGLGRANLKKLTEKTGVKVFDVEDSPMEEQSDREQKGNFFLFAPNKVALKEAEDMIEASLEAMFKEPELDFNGIYTATIEEIRPTGVMVTLYPNMQPTLLPNSQLDIRPINHPSALNYQPGQQIQVKYFGRDPATGQMRLSRKSLLVSSTARVHRSPMA